MKVKFSIGLVLSLALLLGSVAGAAASEESNRLPPVKTQQLAPHIWYLHAAGGNMTALIGNDGTLLVDAEFAPFVPEIIDKLETLGGGAPKFVINTHYHEDHTGGNGAMRAAGATIIAQANVRRRLERVQRAPLAGSAPRPVPADKYPTLIFEDSITLHFDGEIVRVIHLPPAHTDGDSIVIFKQANVVATGDIFFNGMYPYIDVDAGGSVGGSIAAIDRVLPWLDDETVVIPGHGPVADKAALVRYRDMLVSMRDKIKKMVNAGMTLEEIQAARPTSELDPAWDRLEHGQGAHRFVAEIYYSLRPHFPGT